MAEGSKSDGNTPRGESSTKHIVAVASQSALVKKTANMTLESGSPEGSEGQPENSGNLSPDHPWVNSKPNLTLKMKDTVMASKEHSVPERWIYKNNLDLKRIYAGLPLFLSEMKEKAEVDASREMPRKSTDKPSFHSEPFKASSSRSRPILTFLNSNSYYLLTHLPDFSLPWFNVEDRETWCQLRIADGQKKKRWVFIPSYCRAKIALLNWPEKDDEAVHPHKTHRILVVRPSEFDEYVKCCGHHLPVVSLPSNESGAGYARHWIQKIAFGLDLKFIWMIDDSVECFYEYQIKKNEKGESRPTYTLRKFGEVFKRIEKLVSEKRNCNEPPIAAMSPTRFSPIKPLLKSAFICKPPQGAVYLNLGALSSKNVFYRPELSVAEDMVFGYECEQNGLKVFVDQRFHMQDRTWTDSGARSSSSKIPRKVRTV